MKLNTLLKIGRKSRAKMDGRFLFFITKTDQKSIGSITSENGGSFMEIDNFGNGGSVYGN